jgi:nitrite reductase/ring-hydroxylating ferredoxin subunit
MVSKIRIFLLFIVLFLVFPNCDDTEDYMPDILVNVQIDPATLSQFAIGSATYCPYEGGVKGIIIYRESQDQFYAFERLCTYYPQDTCAINIDNSKTTGTCPCCNSSFSLLNGSVLNDPAQYPLKQYKTSIITGRLYITN